MKLVAGNSNRPLAEAIGAYLKIPLAKCIVRRFAEHPSWLRFGLPGTEAEWQRLGAALRA